MPAINRILQLDFAFASPRLCVKKCLTRSRKDTKGIAATYAPGKKSSELLGFTLGWYFHLDRAVLNSDFVAGTSNLAARIIEPRAVLQAESPCVPWAHDSVVFDMPIRK